MTTQVSPSAARSSRSGEVIIIIKCSCRKHVQPEEVVQAAAGRSDPGSAEERPRHRQVRSEPPEV